MSSVVLGTVVIVSIILCASAFMLLATLAMELAGLVAGLVFWPFRYWRGRDDRKDKDR